MSLQALRGAAAVLVVLHHVAGTLAQPKYYGIDIAGGLLFPLGRAGVDVFFVLSGFIIYYVHHGDIGRAARLRHYAVRRLARIYPTYWAVLALVLAALVVDRRDELPNLAVIVQSALLIPFTRPGELTIVGVAWTLSHELLFYAGFGLLILSRRAGALVLALWLVLLLLARVAPSLPPPVNFLLHVKNLEFFMGIAVARLVLVGRCRAGWPVAAAGAALFAATGVVELASGGDFVASAPTLLYGAGAALVILAVAAMERARDGFSVAALLVRLGGASYSIYLVHFGLVVALVKLAHAHLPLAGGFVVPALFVAIAAAAVAGGMGFHAVVERPLIALSQRLLLPARAPARLRGA